MASLALNGQVNSEVKIISYQPLMVRLTVTTEEQTINCLSVKAALDLIAWAHIGTKVAIYGHYNQKHQFVIRKFMTTQPRQITA